MNKSIQPKFKVGLYSYDDFINYNPKDHYRWFWNIEGEFSRVDPITEEEYEIIFPKEEFDKAQLKLQEIYNTKIEKLFEKVKTNFEKRWIKSGNKEQLIQNEIGDYEKLLLEEKLDISDPNLGVNFILEIKFPYAPHNIDYEKATVQHQIDRSRGGREYIEGEDCPTKFWIEDIKKVRNLYREIIIDGTKNLERTAPNGFHPFEDALYIEVEVYHKFFEWLKDFRAKPNKIISPGRQISGLKEPQCLEELFKNRNMVEPAISILKKLKILDQESNFCGQDRTAFKIWLICLDNHGFLNPIVFNNRTYKILAKILPIKFPGLTLYKDGSTLKNVGTRATEYYEERIDKLVSELSKVSSI